MQPVVRFTDTSHGSFGLTEPDADLTARRRAVTAHPVTWLRQVHGADVVVVDRPGGHAGVSADAAVTTVPGAALCAITADCAPVTLVGAGVIGVAHAGWRGLVAGVLPATVAAMRELGATDVVATLGPCIRPRCYAFGADDLDRVAGVAGDAVRSTTADGKPALDVAAAVRGVLARAGVGVLEDTGVCTACSPVHFSHRARADSGRQAAFVWLEP